MKLPKKIGDTEPIPHKLKAAPFNVMCDHCEKRIRVKLYIQKISAHKYMDFFTCQHCQTRYNVSVVTKTGLKLRAKISARVRSQTLGPDFNDLQRRYATMVSDPEVRVVKAQEAQ